MERNKIKEKRVVIVGGGICGLATSLALHRKGIESVILEKRDTLCATGAAIIVQPNGWRALHQLGVSEKLKQTCVTITSGEYTSVEDGKKKNIPIGNGELRCLKRMDLINTLADSLPFETIRFGCGVLSVKLDPITSSPILQLHDGTILKPKVVIGCDGVNSVIASILGLNKTRLFSSCVIRGFTDYGNGHPFGYQFLVWGKDQVQLGLLPITNKTVYWFVTRKLTNRDSMISRDQELIKESTLESVKGFPTNIIHLIINCQVNSLHLTDLRYRPPWDLLFAKFRKANITVAGDAMHAMGPFLAQGGSASLEDAVVLARCLSEKLQNNDYGSGKGTSQMNMVDKALINYTKQRKMRVFWLSLQTFLIGTTIDNKSGLQKLISIIFLIILFRGNDDHTQYDCGRL